MKKYFTTLLSATIFCVSIPQQGQAQIVNGGFEAYNQIPRGSHNIVRAPNTKVAGAYDAAYDDLAAWSSWGPYTTADFLYNSPASAPIVNPQGSPAYGKFLPRTGNGCAAILREPGSYSFDQFITQRVTNLQVNQRYRASFYAHRQPGGQLAEKLLLAVNYSTEPLRYVYNRTTQKQDISPTPDVIIESEPIGDTPTWTLVTGTFIAQASSASISIGYSEAGLSSYDPNLSGTGGSFYYAIDDVSLTLVPCTPPPPPDFNLLPLPRDPGAVQTYDVRVPNGYSTDYFEVTITEPDPPYNVIGGGTLAYNVYNGPTTYGLPSELQGFTTFHLHLIGPMPNAGPNRYRVIVTAVGCDRSTLIKTFSLTDEPGSGVNLPGPQKRKGTMHRRFLPSPTPQRTYLCYQPVLHKYESSIAKEE
ncbi:hypothetical protein [Hymenobacter cellulosilyticus]|uniref:Uncharacterized protein n=1 Tax=Hymenobacter cellulosilyticus TaxID=2932248 RepID=A0A8T9Q698_9BACT|nr:hypothetical protein [Hymenobacter cellulosilyticus]UOQ70979.1 hypothetical protein MUN79_20210 [Hymenobacter cellulosilyticus]